jgi:hypothetical protein
MIGRIQQCIDLRDRHALVRFSYLHDFVACADFAFLQDTKVESRPPARRQQSRHARLVGADADTIASDTRLRDLEQRAADPVPVANADIGIGHAFDREVLAELSVDEVGPS